MSCQEEDTDVNVRTRYLGIGVSPGRAVGPVKKVFPRVSEPAARFLPAEKDPYAEVERVQQAAAQTAANLRLRAELTGGAGAEVLHTAAQIAEDPVLLEVAADLIVNRLLVPARAVWEAAELLAETLREMGGYMADRALDVFDVRDRIIARLCGRPAPGLPTPDIEHVLWAADLAPSDTALLDVTKVKAIVISEGGPTSHTAIVARELGLPCVVAAPKSSRLRDGMLVLVDGAAGTVTVDPTEEQVNAAQERIEKRVFDGVGQLACGHRVPLLANISDAAGAAKAAAVKAEGIGLLRTELMYLGLAEEPDIDTQIAHYTEIFEAAPPGRIVVRTLDAGSDKPLAYLPMGREANPALGMRGYRISRKYRDVLTRQLKAIAAAREATGTDVWVMAPMISTPGEASEFVQACREAGLPAAGIMVEVPSSALRAKQILAEADFASIGTNDLSQYTMGSDRLLGALADLTDPWHPAVLDLIEATCRGGQQQDRPVGVCGEAAADPALAVVLVGLGVASLSMAARSIADVAAVLETVTLAQARELAGVALAADSARSARQAVRDRLDVLPRLGL